ncbi:ribonuclease HII [Novosphingobium sp. 1949]|uniref:Ribonuclease HII n=1 Tax=Novosphingobium organovorum TaxID=2930092 RepID=A0ABT0B8P7_9SPHN|nr:ribonuclease HII [Novosphingobium organovorum]MCJ2181218.1 ribonuclease HII [Novosphingobium organovorum]
MTLTPVIPVGGIALASPRIMGIDEAGRGPLAGPVVAAAVLLGKNAPEGLDDSKKLSGKRRLQLETEIHRTCLWAVGVVDVETIDRINIFAATMLAMTRAAATLCSKTGIEPEEVLIDGNKTPQGRCEGWRWDAVRAIVGGDALEPSISAASIVAKQHRDKIMRVLAQAFPQYGWERNAGYGTAGHLAALREHGPSPHHRRSFSPIAQLEMPF